MSFHRQSDFERGRSDALHIIGRKLRDYYDNTENLAKNLVPDCFGDGDAQEVGSAFELVVFAAEHTLSQSLTNFKQAQTDLLGGKTLFDLTCQTAIKTYHPIIGGDYIAGVHSAGEDFIVALMAYNHRILADLAYADLIESSDLNESTHQVLKRVTGYCSAVLQDSLISFVQENVKDISRHYETIVYGDGYNPVEDATFVKQFVQAVKNIEHHTGRNSRRSEKIISSWPKIEEPFHPLFSIRPNPANDDIADYNWQRFPVNTSQDFVRGFKDTLRCIYLQVQDYHFSSREHGTYAANLGISLTWEKAAGALSTDLSINIRNAMLDLIHSDEIRGDGTTYEQGFEAARAWAKSKIFNQDTPLTKQNPQNRYIAERLKGLCISMVNETYLEKQQDPAPDNDGHYDDPHYKAA